ncbi:MAG: hybrid sensor histidine kinase/response regulator [Caulobacterales bacterium]
MHPIRPVTAAENPALAAALDSILRTQWARYVHIGTWALGVWAACGFWVAACWCAVTMGMGYVRGLAERRLADGSQVSATDLRDLYPWIAAGVGVFWAAAPVFAWLSGEAFGRMLAVLMLSAGYLMVLTQFRGAPRAAIIVSAPYTAVFVFFTIDAFGTPWFAACLAAIPILASALVFGLIHGLVAQNRMIRAQLAAERERSRLALALDAAHAVVWEIDLEAHDVLADDRLAGMFGQTLAFEPGYGVRLEHVHDEDAAAVDGLFAQAMAAPSRHRLTFRIRHPRNGELWLSSAVESFAGPTGRVARIMVMTLDVTDQKQREADLRKLSIERDAAEAANAAKSQFLANMSHELRTPLNAIIGYSELLCEDAETRNDADSQRDLARVLGAARRLLQLINDVLDLSKIEAGRLELEIGAVDVVALLAESADTVRPIAAQNGNILTVAIDGDLGDVRTDGFRLGQCLLNLLSNAAKFTRDGRIDVRARRDEGSNGGILRIDVADTGAGLTPEQIARLFQPFAQADASVTRKFGGTGLGLVITRRIAQSLGGDVSVESRPGQGATFTLRIAATPASDDAAGGDLRTDGPRALVIDDDPAARDLVRRAFARRGVMVDGAVDGGSGRQALDAARYDLVVLDINLPDMSGWDLLAALKRDPASAATPVIVLSIDDDRARSLGLGAIAHLTKPADFDALAAMATRLLRPIEPTALSA